MMKRSPIICISILIIVSMCAVVSAHDKPETPTIDVTGTGIIRVEPNMVTVVFSVETSDKKAADALRKNALSTQGLIEALSKASKEAATITTSSFSVYPLYDKDSGIKSKSGRPDPGAFRVNNSVIVKTPGVKEVGALIDAAVDAGANRIGSLSFGRSDYDQLARQAAGKALENAVEYGEELAKASGLTIKRILYIRYVPGNAAFDFQDMALAEERISTPIAPGMVPIESFVNVTFEVH